MTWLTWRQFRAAATMMGAVLVVLAAALAFTGPGVADDYSTGIAACTTQTDGCATFLDRFFQQHQTGFLAVTAAVLLLPAIIGLFWGAPLITRELESDTHQLVWNQSITRTRWLTAKLGLTGLASMISAGLVTLAVTWWSGPIDKVAGVSDFPRMGPVVFDARGIVPIGYAAFAFTLGVVVGMLVRRTLPAMTITLAVFLALQIAMPLLVRPHLFTPTHATVKISSANVDGLSIRRKGGPITLTMLSKAPDKGAWILSSRLIDAKGRTVHGSLPLSSASGPCAPGGSPADAAKTCFAEINRLGYRQEVTYHSSKRFWDFQWAETGIYLGLTAGLAGGCFWWIRRRQI
ncbi:ABC transporter permease subunit [Streptomyces lutosisoli]|uniref:ABC transporter permease subunit n=1 Tax=Streptomyces lutosisoli TaxID=2665721 RepID=A0ABW2VL43_9ACTN